MPLSFNIVEIDDLNLAWFLQVIRSCYPEIWRANIKLDDIKALRCPSLGLCIVYHIMKSAKIVENDRKRGSFNH